MTIEELIKNGEVPEWMTEEGYLTLSRGYLLPNETPKNMYARLADAAANYYRGTYEGYTHFYHKFFNIMWKGWLGPASPVLSNFGAGRALPISCYSLHVGDSVDSIFSKNYELALLSKNGGGVGIYLGDVRGRGKEIKNNGNSEGIVPWCKVYDTTTNVVSQGGVRRGASALYLDVEHFDIDEFLNIRRPVGDVNRRCLNINQGICISDEWMQALMDGDLQKRALWEQILKSRIETGEPYLFFKDNVNRQNPDCYKALGLEVKTSNICTEISLYTDPDHTFICCLSSLNLTKWDEWKDTDTVQMSIYFLDAIMSDFIDLTEGKKGFEASRNSAVKGRPLGLGVMGWHTLLQDKGFAFDSFDAMQLNAKIFSHIRKEADIATGELAERFENPQWCPNNRRNTHTIAIAPTVSNSAISGGISAGIEPLAANIFAVKSAKGTFFRKNPALIRLLAEIGQDTPEVWAKINSDGGSVQNLDFLTEDQKKIFLTAREINQHAIIKQAAQRQKWVDQAQSINLFFGTNSDPKYIHQVHIEAWKAGIKTLYYLRAEGVLKGDNIFKDSNECEACSG